MLAEARDDRHGCLVARPELGGILQMHAVAVVGFTILIFIVCTLLQAATALPVYWTLTISTVVWAAWSSRRIQLRRYRPGEAFHPVLLFWAVVQLWPITFPWYILLRRRILTGRLQRGVVFHEDDVVY